MVPLAFRVSILLFLAAGRTQADGGGNAAAAALLKLKSTLSDPTGALVSWTSSAPCNASSPWPGVQCYNGGVIGLRLAHFNLSGAFAFASLVPLPGLHTLDLRHNNLSGPLASLADLRSLRAAYMSHNAFTGPVPGAVFANLRWLKKLYLDNNNLSGDLPAGAIAGAARLLELHLDANKIEGPVPELLPASLRLLNVSHNLLSGALPPAVAVRFAKSAFADNPDLCGAPGSDADACANVAPAPATLPPEGPADYFAVEEETSVFVVIGIILVVVALVTGAMVLMLRQDERSNATSYDYVTGGGHHDSKAAEMVAMEVCRGGGGSSHGSSSSHGSGKRMGEITLMSEASGQFGMADLMKATAEVLGNGTLGSAYKAAMRNGVTVAVKRMRDMNRVGRDEFEEHLQTLGQLRHPNVLAPVGYHFRKEEKLIVSEFMPRGSLLYVLHGDQSPDRVVLDWPARLKIAVGVARGMAYLHEKLGMRLVSMDGADFDAPPPPSPHGNLKSGNILLDDALEPRIVDYGFFPLVNAAQVQQAMFAFRAPECASALQHKSRAPVSARSDVWCLGVVLLELVTGRFPSQYLLNARGGTDVVEWAAAAVAERREQELVDPVIAAGAGAAVLLLRVAVECTNPMPESRPNMAEAARMVENVASGRAS